MWSHTQGRPTAHAPHATEGIDQKEDYLPEALLNYVVRLGWSHGDQECFTLGEMVGAFDIKDVNKSASAFNAEKLLWLDQQYIMRAPAARLAAGLAEQLVALGIDPGGDEQRLVGVATAQRERARTLKEMAQSSVFFFLDFERFDENAAAKHLIPVTLPLLQALREGFAVLPEWNAGAVHKVINALATRSSQELGKSRNPCGWP